MPDPFISSVSYSNSDIMNNIIKLHNDGLPFEADVTYSKGVFYKNGEVPQPKFKFDISVQADDVVQASSLCLPIADNSLASIVFDPPFLAGGSPSEKSIMSGRFSYFKSVDDLWEYYQKSLSELNRVLTPKGVLAMKCQDTTYWHRNYFSHCAIMNLALKLELYPQDLFILVGRSRLHSTWKNQRHARKFHSYWWVFRKRAPHHLHFMESE